MSGTVRQRAIMADFIQARREQLDLSMQEIAKRCGKGRLWFRRIERGDRAQFDTEDIEVLERALELPTGALLKRAEDAGFAIVYRKSQPGVVATAV